MAIHSLGGLDQVTGSRKNLDKSVSIYIGD